MYRYFDRNWPRAWSTGGGSGDRPPTDPGPRPGVQPVCADGINYLFDDDVSFFSRCHGPVAGNMSRRSATMTSDPSHT